MSLINKMLQDLDARTGAFEGAMRSPRDGLMPVTGVSERSTHHYYWLGGGLIGILFSAWVGIYWLDLFSQGGGKLDVTAQAVPIAASPMSTARAPVETEEHHKGAVVASAGADVAGDAEPEPRESTRDKVTVSEKGAVVETPVAPRNVRTSVSPVPRAKTSSSVKVAAVAPGRKNTGHINKKRRSTSPPVRTGQIKKVIRPMTPIELAESAYQRGLRQLKQGQITTAEQSLRASLGHDERHVQARELLASLYLKQGRWVEVEQLLKDGQSMHPRHYRFAQVLGRMYTKQGDLPRALSVLEKQRVRGRSDPEYMALLGAVYQRSQRHAEAADAYRTAVAKHPYEGRWWLGLAISLEAQNDAAGAKEAYRRATVMGLDAKLKRYAQQRLAALE